MSPTLVGIDPGKGGGIAWLDSLGKVDAQKMPADESDLWSLLQYVCPGSVVAVEKVHAMPGNGVAGMFRFGQNYGSLRMGVMAAGGSLVDVAPQKWQRDLDCLTGGDKNITKLLASALFPHLRVTHAIADALLLVEWLRRTGHEKCGTLC